MIPRSIGTHTSVFVAAIASFFGPSVLTSAMTTVGTTNKMPSLKGVVFDMDDTLVQSKLDIPAMYKKVFGEEPSDEKNFDILKEIREIPNLEEQARAYRIIDEMEEESRQNMELMPGCVELLSWLSAHKIPSALVTRNSNKSTKILCDRLGAVERERRERGYNELSFAFRKIITRDDKESDNERPIPPKPDPRAMKIIARESFDVTIDERMNEILMVGDSVANDVAFGKNAGVQTALLANYANEEADLCVDHLSKLPSMIWKNFEIQGPLGNTPEANQQPLHGSPAPKPHSKICKAVVDEDTSSLRVLLEELSLLEIMAPDEGNKNTALIWAAETGNVGHASLLLEKVAAKSENDPNQLITFINHRGFLGATALNRAARRGNLSVLEYLLSSTWKDAFDLDLPNEKLQHPLHFAAFKKHPKTLEYLLKCGANPWVLDRKGRTPLEDTSCEICKSLLHEAMAQTKE